MDPTRQRRQDPLKAILDKTVFATATYLLPTVAAGALMLLVEPSGIPLSAIFFYGTLYYWAIVYGALTSYRWHLLFVRTFDISLDPPPSRYLRLLLDESLLALSIPLLVALVPGRVLTASVTFTATVGVWVFVGLRELARAQREGLPQLEDGAMGGRLKPVGLLRDITHRQRRNTQPTIWWGGVKLELAELLKNFLILGAIGSGKTLVLKKFLQCLLPLILSFRQWRAMIIDPKWELYPFLLALLPSYKIKRINPGERDGCAWRIKDDLKDEVHIRETTHIFIPGDEKESQPFFTNGARRLLFATILALRLQAPEGWWFSDPFFAIQSRKHLETILGLHRQTREILETYSQNQKVFFDVLTTLDSKLDDYYAVAALWSHVQRDAPDRTVSLSEWVQGNFVLLIGKPASASAAHGKIIEALVHRSSQLLLDQPTGQSILDPATSRRTIIVVDEAPRAGKLEIMDLVTNGRDYGIGVCLAGQSVEALYKQYPKDRWDAIANEFHSLAFLSTNSATTARWMSDRLGKIAGSRDKPDEKKFPGRTSPRETWTPALDPTQFQTLGHGKKVSPGCIPGIFFNSQLGAWYCQEGVDLIEPLAGVPQRTPAKPCSFRRWDEEDLRRLNLSHLRDELDLDDDAPGGGSRRPQRPSGPRPKSSSVNYPRFRP